MSQDNARAWLKQLGDRTVFAAAKEADDPLAHLVEAGAETGFSFTADDLAQCAGSDELSETQLESVAGGIPEVSPIGIVITKLQNLASIPSVGPINRE